MTLKLLGNMIMDSMDWTPGECCRQAAIEADSNDVDACIIIMLDKGPTGDHYHTMLRNSGLKLSEIISLLEIKKLEMIKAMLGG